MHGLQDALADSVLAGRIAINANRDFVRLAVLHHCSCAAQVSAARMQN
jgi:hypothetical protein